MGLRDKSYAKIWSARKIGKIYSVRMTISRKDQKTGEYENQFGGFVNFAGDAAEKIRELGLPERSERGNSSYRSIQITRSPDITTYYDAQYINKLLSLAKGNDELEKFIRNNSNTTSITIWDFELAEDSNGDRGSSKRASRSSNKRRNPEPEPEDGEEEDSDLPF